MDTNSQVERKKKKIAGLGAQKKLAHSCAFLCKILAFLRKILAFLRVLARCFRVVKPEIVWYFLVWTYWGQESEFQRRTNRVAVGFEFLQKKATKITTWPLNLEWQGQLKAERSRCQRVNTWKWQLSLKQKHLGLKKRSELLPKEIGLCWVRLMALVPILAIKSLRCCTLRCCRKLPEVAMFEFLHNYLWDPLRCLLSKYNIGNS